MVSSVLLYFGGMLAVCSAVAWHVCVCSFHHCSWAWGQIPVQRYVASAHAQAMCRRALLAWRGVLVAYFFSWFLSLPLLSWSRVSSPPPILVFFPLLWWFVHNYYFHWPSCLSVTGTTVGGLVAGLVYLSVFFRLGMWLRLQAPWPMSSQPPLATRALNVTLFTTGASQGGWREGKKEAHGGQH